VDTVALVVLVAVWEEGIKSLHILLLLLSLLPPLLLQVCVSGQQDDEGEDTEGERTGRPNIRIGAWFSG
jgi:hypothetical protein